MQVLLMKACPECGSDHRKKVQWGLPLGPPDDDVILAGLSIKMAPDRFGAMTELPADVACGDCGYRWVSQKALQKLKSLRTMDSERAYSA